jgi:hypothetical protein
VGWGAAHVVAAVAGLGAILLARRRLGVLGSPWALAALAWAGAVAAAPAALRPGDPDARLRAPGPKLAAAPPGPRVVMPYAYEPAPPPSGGDRLDRSIRLQAAQAIAAFNVRSRVDNLEPYCAMAPRRLVSSRLAFGPRWSLAARRYGTTHVVVDDPRSPEHSELRAVATVGGRLVAAVPGEYQIWAVPHRAWARFVPEVHPADSDEAAVVAALSAFIQDSPSAVVEGAGPFGVAPGRVLSLAREPERVQIEAEAAGPATLVVSDAWWPGWEATLDGEPVAILRADLFVRAVRWPAGRHVLVMRYRPPEVAAGLAASALGLVALAALAARLRRRASGETAAG